MAAAIKVVHLELNGEHYYFGSPKAMFDVFDKSVMGMTYNSFHSNVHLKPGIPYVNARKGYIIRVGSLTQAKTNRNNRLSEIIKAHMNDNPFALMPETSSAPAPAASVSPANEPSAPTTTKRKKKDKDVPEQLTLF